MIAASGSFASGSGDGGSRRLRAVLAADRDELLAALPALQRLRPRAVHRTRVLARRMRAMLRVYAPAFDRTRARRARRVLKELARALEACREADVREALFGEIMAADQAGSSAMPALLDARLAQCRAEARRAAARWLASAEPGHGLRDALRRLEVVDDLPACWLLERLACRARVLEQRLDRSRGDRGLHRVRLAVKSLRYALAPLEDLAPATGQRLQQRLRVAQQRLGEQHDASLALAWLETEPRTRRALARGIRRRLAAREHVARRAARHAAQRIGPAWHQWHAEARAITAEPSDRPGRA